MSKAKVITVPEAARRYALNDRYLRKLCERGKVKAERLGRDWLISAASLEEYLAAPHPRGRKPKKRPEVAQA